MHTPDLPSAAHAFADTARPACIGVFDSGVGGLSVLRELHRRLPAAALVYVGDVSHAPYGERPASELLARCELIVEHLAAQGARLIVVACNTATVTCLTALRRRWPAMSFVGVEPGVKPGASRSRTRRIAVMGTTATLQSARLRWLVERHAIGVHVHLQPCPGLADVIERGELTGPALMEVLAPCCDSIRGASVDTVVLACTHYPFVATEIQRLLGPDIDLIDTASAVVDRVASLWTTAAVSTTASLRVQSTGATQAMLGLLQQCPGFETTQVERLGL